MIAYNFAISGSNLTKVYQATCRETGVISWVQRLEGMTQTKFVRVKKVQNLARFLTTIDFERK